MVVLSGYHTRRERERQGGKKDRKERETREEVEGVDRLKHGAKLRELVTKRSSAMNSEIERDGKG